MSSNQNSKQLIAENIEVNDSKIGVQVNDDNGYESVVIRNAKVNRCEVGFQLGAPLSPAENLQMMLPNISPFELSKEQIKLLIEDLLTAKSENEMEEKFQNSSLKEKLEDITTWINFGNALLPLLSPLLVLATNNF